MKIGFVIDDSLDRGDGVQQYVLALGRWFTGAGHEVHYLAGHTTRTDIANVHSLSRNISVRFNGNRMTTPLPASPYVIKSLLDQEHFDILHVQMPYSPLLGARVIKRAPTSTVCVGTFHILPFGLMQRLGVQLLSWWLLPSLRHLQQVWSVSGPAQLFAHQLGIASEVLPNVVETNRLASGRKLSVYQKTFTVVFLGRLVERKGCMQLLQAIKLLHEQKATPGLRVVICGSGPQAEQLQAWVETRGLQDYVDFKGYISESEKADYLKSADVAIFPSLGGESFGIVLIEAMAAGSCVVLGGNNPGYMSVLHPVPEALFDPYDAQAIAGLLAQIHDDPVFAKQLHARQQILVKQYDVAVVGEKLLSYYQELIS